MSRRGEVLKELECARYKRISVRVVDRKCEKIEKNRDRESEVRCVCDRE